MSRDMFEGSGGGKNVSHGESTADRHNLPSRSIGPRSATPDVTPDRSTSADEAPVVTGPALAANRAKVQHVDQLAGLRRTIRSTLEAPGIDEADLDDFIMAVHETVANVLDQQLDQQPNRQLDRQLDRQAVGSSTHPGVLVAWYIFERPNGGASELRSRIRILGTMPPAIDPLSLRGTIVRHVTDTITVTELIGGSIVEIRCALSR